jgi:putative hydrolase of the HAD superfamily
LALQQLHVQPSEAVMIGDWAERDMVGAKNVGMYTAFAKYGDSFGNQNVTADHILSDISDILRFVEQHNKV